MFYKMILKSKQSLYKFALSVNTIKVIFLTQFMQIYISKNYLKRC